jgi:uncharacterized protein YukJ
MVFWSAPFATAGKILPGKSPHYEIWVRAGQNYRIAVNVRSVDGSDVLAHYDPNFTKPTKRYCRHAKYSGDTL